ncbi:hypothetical protein [Nocardioides terrisoli]|uniref:hypothetical protein n=1 Tax=Nocardioides terrisoli TaxID=3388267 RepID=UPI00287BB71D|nr:hypothetical protein [Nocardioides marmorisolisilvae]
MNKSEITTALDQWTEASELLANAMRATGHHDLIRHADTVASTTQLISRVVIDCAADLTDSLPQSRPSLAVVSGSADR